MSCFPEFDLKQKDALARFAFILKGTAVLTSQFSPEDTIRAMHAATMMLVNELDICPTCVWNVLGDLFEKYEEDWNARHPEAKEGVTVN